MSSGEGTEFFPLQENTKQAIRRKPKFRRYDSGFIACNRWLLLFKLLKKYGPAGDCFTHEHAALASKNAPADELKV